MKPIKQSLITTLLLGMLSSTVMAKDCSYELFSISSTKNTKIIDFVEQLSDECEFSILVSDPNADEFLNSTLNKTNFNNLTIDEVLNIVLKENNLSYKLENNILKISYLETKMFNIDYILSQRKSTGSTDVTLSSEGAGLSDPNQARTMNTNTTNQQGAGGGGAGKSGIKIESTDEVQFWHELDLELQKVINRPEDRYTAEAPLINKNAGIITVTATSKQMDRLEKYLKTLQDRVQYQVLIDVQLLSVTMNEGKSTGVDWSQLYAMQNIQIGGNVLFHKNVGDFTEGLITTATTGEVQSTQSNLINIGIKGSLNEVIKFLKTQGDVSSISNPKVLTLNNQPAIISAGTEYFYKIKTSNTLAGGNTGTTTEQENVQSVFAGVLLDITPEIADDKTITLKINPSISETAYDISSITSENRKMPPDLKRRQLSSVVTVEDGNRIILGGLINTSNILNQNKVPILGDIPILNYLFKYESKQKLVQELVIVIEPKIVTKFKKDLSLSDLGYKNISENVLKSAAKSVEDLTKE